MTDKKLFDYRISSESLQFPANICSVSTSLHSAFAQLWTELEGKNCKSTMTKTKTMTGKIR